MSDSLRILQLASHATVDRGGAVQMLRLAQGLVERGHRVTAAFNTTRLNDHPAIQRAQTAGVSVIALPLAGEGNALQKLWRTEKFNILHVHREQSLIAAAAALKKESVPAFIAQRGTVYLPPFLGLEHRLLLSRRIHRIVAVAQAVKTALVRRRFISPKKIEVVYGGVETEIFHPGIDGSKLRAQHNVPPDAKLITLPGALIQKKGPQFFLQAAALIKQTHPTAHFWLVGSGKLESELRALAQQLNLTASLQFLGHIPGMPEVYAASDLVVCASIKGEGLTGTLREALAMARPVVTTACAGNTELVEANVTGYVCQPADAPSLAAAIQRVLNDPAGTNTLAQAGQARVLTWCNEPVRSEKMENIYKAVLSSGG